MNFLVETIKISSQASLPKPIDLTIQEKISLRFTQYRDNTDLEVRKPGF